MRKILSKTRKIGSILCLPILFSSTALAQETNINSSSYGFNLPTPVNPHGFDEVRAADGTTCRSSISGNGPYLDVGGLGGQDHNGNSNGATVYGRVVIPLGKKPDRLDCGNLYQLEIQRLQHELRLARSGIGLSQNSEGTDWSKSGWDNNSK